jgi:hypothetical protein
MAGSPGTDGGRYDHFGWRVSATPLDISVGRLTETHEYFHRQLDDTTAFGGLIGTIAALADVHPDDRWSEVRRRLQDMTDLVHETFAVGMSLLTTQRSIEPIANYPTYDRHVRTAHRLISANVHPWVALAALRAAAMACMQTDALGLAVRVGLETFDPSQLPRMERPNQRLAALLAGDFAHHVEREHALAQQAHSAELWWRPSGAVRLSPDSMDGEASEAHEDLHRRLLHAAKQIVICAGGSFIELGAHHGDMRELLAQARALSPGGLTRIGALVESPGGELLHGGPLDGQIVELSLAPLRAVVLPYGSASAISGEGEHRHVFVALTTRHRLSAAHELEGIELPESDVLACARSTVFNGHARDPLLLLPIDSPEQLNESAPVYLCVLSSAAAADPAGTSSWMNSVDPQRLSLVMDTPATAALRRWCSDGARFLTATRLIRVEDQEVRIIAGRVVGTKGQSALVIIPSTEFGARWFEQACAEDDVLSTAVVEDSNLFDRDSAHLDIVLNHLVYEERFLGTGSWRR